MEKRTSMWGTTIIRTPTGYERIRTSMSEATIFRTPAVYTKGTLMSKAISWLLYICEHGNYPSAMTRIIDYTAHLQCVLGWDKFKFRCHYQNKKKIFSLKTASEEAKLVNSSFKLFLLFLQFLFSKYVISRCCGL